MDRNIRQADVALSRQQVAPHAGAWIETMVFSDFSHDSNVAPHAGAWIETCRV